MLDSKYHAFISYRHNEPDKTIAELLHRLLENYRVPRSVAKKTGIKKIQRVFRDKEELPSSSNLAGSIETALEQSQYLIVVCSSQTPLSPWVKKEIEYFLALKGPHKILTILIEGEPATSFPEAIRFLPNSDTENEPLAADIRAGSLKDMKRKLRKEILRLLAPMLQCNYDDLKQRHRERLVRRTLTLSIASSVFFLGFGSFSVYQSQQIQLHANRVSQEIQKTLKGQSLYLADVSKQLLLSGDRRRAMLAAREALPQNLEQPERPYVEEAEYALCEALSVYETNNRYMVDGLLEHKKLVDAAYITNDGKTALTITQDGFLTYWDIDSGNMIKRMDINAGYVTQKSIILTQSDTMICPTERGLVSIDLKNASINWTYDGYITQFILSHDEKRLFVISDNVTELDIDTGAVKTETPLSSALEAEKAYAFVNCASVDDSASKLFMGTNSGKVIIFDIKSSVISKVLDTGNESVDAIACSTESYLAVSSSNLIESSTISYFAGFVEIWDTESWQSVGKISSETDEINQLTFHADNPDLLFMTRNEILDVYNLADKKVTQSFSGGNRITDYEVFDNMVLASSTDGTIRFYILDGKGYEYEILRITLQDSISSFYVKKGVFVVFFTGSNRAVLLKDLQNNRALTLDDSTGSAKLAMFTSDQKLVITAYYDSNLINVWNTKDHTLFGSIESNSPIDDAQLVDNDQKLLLLHEDGQTALYDVNTLKVIKQIQLDGFLKHSFSADQKYCLIESDAGLEVYETASLNKLCTIEGADFYQAAFIKDQILISSPYGTASLYNVKTGKKIEQLMTSHMPGVFSNPEGSLLALIYEDNTIHLYNADDMNEVMSITDMDSTPLSVHFEPTGQYLYVGMDDFSVRCYNLISKKLVETLEGLNASLVKIQFDPATNRLITFNDRREAILWHNNRKIAYFSSILAMDNGFHNLIIGYGSQLIMLPCYNTAMLVEEAASQLKGRTLTIEEKKKLFIID